MSSRLVSAVAGLVVLVIVAGSAFRLWLEVPQGERWLARLLSEQVSARVLGELRVERVDLRGLSSAVASGVELRPPEGEPVLRAGSVKVEASLGELLHERTVIDRVGVQGLELELGPQGGQQEMGLARALAPDGPRSDGTRSDDTTSTEIIIQQLRIELDRLSYRPEPGAEASWAAEDGLVTGSLEVSGDGIELDARAEVELVAPFSVPAVAELAARLENGRLEVTRLSATLPGGIQLEAAPQDQAQLPARPTPGSVLERVEAWLLPAAWARGASGEEQPHGQGPERRGGFHLPPLRVSITLPPDGLVPYGGPALRGPLRVEGTLATGGQQTELDLHVEPPGPGYARVEGWFEPGDPGRFWALVDVRDVNPAKVLRGSPAGRIFVAVEASGALRPPPAADTRATLWMAKSRLDGERIGPGEAELRVNGARILVDAIELDLPGAHLRGTLAAGGERPLVAGMTATVQELAPLLELVRALGVDAPSAAGSVQARLHVSGAGEQRRIAVEASAPRLSVSGREVTDLEARFELEGQQLKAALDAGTAAGPVSLEVKGVLPAPERARLTELRAELAEASWSLAGPAVVDWRDDTVRIQSLSLTGSGTLAVEAHLPWPQDRFEGAVQAEIRALELPLAALRPFLPEGVPPGTVSVTTELDGTIEAPELDAELQVELYAEPELAQPVSARFWAHVGKTATLAGTIDLPEQPPARLDIELRAAPERSLWSLEGLLAAQVDASLDAPELDLEALSRLGVLPGRASGTAHAELRAAGQVATAELEGAIRVAGLSVSEPDLGRLPPLTAELRIDATRNEVSARLEAEVPGAPPIRAAARLGAPLARALTGRRATALPFTARIDVDRGPLRLPRLDVAAAEVWIAATATGAIGEPEAELQAEGKELTIAGAAVDVARLRAQVQQTISSLSLRLWPRGGGTVVADVEVPARDVWTARLRARDAGLDVLAALPQVSGIEGALADADLELRGGPELTVAGNLLVRARRLSLAGFGDMSDLLVDIRAFGERIEAERLTVRLQRGTTEARGFVDWRGEAARAAISVEADEFPIPTGARPVGEVTARADIALELQGHELAGTLRLSRGTVRLPDGRPGELHPLALPPDIVVQRGLAREAAEPPALARRLAELRAQLRILVPRDFWVRSEAAELELTSDLTALWDGERLALAGDLEAPRGTVAVLRRRFDVERLALTFTGRSVLDPELDGRLALQQRTVRVWVDLAGSLRQPELELSSDPPMDPSEIALLIATGGGGGPVDADAGLTGAVLSSALNFVAGQVAQAFASNLPLDVLAFELGPRGEARRFEAGAYVTPRLFVSLVRNLFAAPNENTNEVQAEYYISRRLSLTTRYGDRQSGGVNLLYERRFRSPAQRRPAREGEGSEPRASRPAIR